MSIMPLVEVIISVMQWAYNMRTVKSAQKLKNVLVITRFKENSQTHNVKAAVCLK